MELPRLSKFKLHLLALISETRDLRERECSARDELQLVRQKQREVETEFDRKFREMQLELGARDESLSKLESKMKCIESENILLKRKQKELKETIDGLLQSRESFLKIYEDSTLEHKHGIATRDRKLAILSDKMHAHLRLIDLIKKEVTALKQTMDTTQRLVSEKEQVVVELKEKIEKVTTMEKTFVEKICFLENKLKSCQDEIRRKDTSISTMKVQLEAGKITGVLQTQTEQKSLMVKDEIIKSLKVDKQALHHELQMVEAMLRKIEETVSNMTAENKSSICLVLEGEEVVRIVNGEETTRFESNSPSSKESYPFNNLGRNSAEHSVEILHQKNKSAIDHSSDKNAPNTCLLELVCSGPQANKDLHGLSLDARKIPEPVMESTVLTSE